MRLALGFAVCLSFLSASVWAAPADDTPAPLLPVHLVPGHMMHGEVERPYRIGQAWIDGAFRMIGYAD